MSQVLTHVTPDTMVFTIAKGKIAFDTTPVRTHPGGKAHFTIRNDDPHGYDVRIPFAEFQPYSDAPRGPINEAASGSEIVIVPPNSAGTLTYVIKPAAHFPFSPKDKKTFGYKYSLYYTDAGTRVETPVDPDLEVSP